MARATASKMRLLLLALCVLLFTRVSAGTSSGPARLLSTRDAFTQYKSVDTTSLSSVGATPAGAVKKSFALPRRAGSTASSSVFTFWSAENPSKTESALIVLHGRKRDAGKYYSTFADILASAPRGEAGSAASKYTTIVAPLFFSAAYDKKARTNPSNVAYADSNAWSAGEASVLPRGAGVSSFAVLDALVARFADQNVYPNMKYITIVGHGGGGQLAQRYAVVAKDNPAPGRLHIRYVVGDPSSMLAFTKDRPDPVDMGTCSDYDSYRYGLSGYTPGASYPLPLGGDALSLFNRYIARDVRYVIGADDTTEANGDQSCYAQAWGGGAREQRSQAYYKYITLLSGGHLSSVSSLYGSFPALGTGSDGSVPQSSAAHVAPFQQAGGPGALTHRITFVDGAKHNAGEVYSSGTGRDFLFAPLSSLSNDFSAAQS